jgi:hypothetical protein
MEDSNYLEALLESTSRRLAEALEPDGIERKDFVW